MGDKANLTEERIRSIKLPVSGEYVLWDSKLTGFGVRCFPSGRKNFILYYRVAGSGRDGQRRRMKIGDVETLRLGEARQIAQTHIGEIAKGNDPQADRQRAARRKGASVAAALDAYEAAIAAREMRNSKHIMSLLRRELGKPFGARDLSEVDRLAVVERIAKLEANGKPGAAKDLRAKANTFFNWAVNRGLVFANPLAGWRRERATRAQLINRKGRALSGAEVRSVVAVLDDVAAPYGDFVMLLLLTGQRRSETAHMKWADVDFENGTWTIPASNAKNGREHNVPLPAQAAALLERQKRAARNRESEFVFPGRTRGSAISGWSKRQADLIEKSGVTFTLHDLRRTFRSGLTRLGVDPDLAEMMLNHQRAELLQIYDHEPRMDERHGAAARWAIHIEGLQRSPDGENVVRISDRIAG